MPHMLQSKFPLSLHVQLQMNLNSHLKKKIKAEGVVPTQLPKLSRKLCNSFKPSAEKLRCTLERGATKLGGGCCWKQTTTAAKLSPLFHFKASSTRS